MDACLNVVTKFDGRPDGASEPYVGGSCRCDLPVEIDLDVCALLDPTLRLDTIADHPP